VQTRRIGSLEVSVVGLGTNNFGGRIDEAASKSVVDAAIDAGVNFFDTADIYGGTKSEGYLGRALAGRRDEVVVATKFGVPYEGHSGGAGAAYVKEAAEDSLRRLGTDRIDLYQLHFPDQKTPIAETLGALGELVAEGKVREIGCSNFSAEMIEEATSAAGSGPRFVSVQNHYNLLQRGADTDGVLAACERHGLAFLPYFPLADGLLTGKYQEGQPPPAGTRLAGVPADRLEKVMSTENLGKVTALAELAAGEGHSVLDLAFAWLLSRPALASVIAGATKPEQIRANVAAGSWELPPDLVARVEAIAPAA